MSKSKSVEKECAPVGGYPWPKPGHEVFSGAGFRIYARKEGMLPENLVPWDERKDTPHADSSHATVHFARLPVGADTRESEIVLSVGDELRFHLTLEEFTEAFLAVVPRWFWKPKDER